MNDTPTPNSEMARLMDEVASLTRDLAAAQEELARVKAEREATLELLAELHAMVKGECPSLLNEDIGGDARTALAIEEMLSKRDAAIAAKGDK